MLGHPVCITISRDCIHHSICRGETHIMYAWAKDAPPTLLPPDVAFKLDPDEYIVLQIHYADQFSEPDQTSVTVRTTPHKPKYFAGIYLLWLGFLVIPPAKDKVSGDMSCVSSIQPPMHVFAFRPHAHSLGRVSLLCFNIKFSLRAITDMWMNVYAVTDVEEKPQMFYWTNFESKTQCLKINHKSVLIFTRQIATLLIFHTNSHFFSNSYFFSKSHLFSKSHFFLKFKFPPKFTFSTNSKFPPNSHFSQIHIFTIQQSLVLCAWSVQKKVRTKRKRTNRDNIHVVKRSKMLKSALNESK